MIRTILRAASGALLFACLGSLLEAATPSVSSSYGGGTYTVTSDVVYATVTDGGGQPLDLLVDLYIPDGATEPLPTVVWIHGGSWNAGTKDAPPIEPLAAAGYCVASISYRLVPDAIWPAQLHDCKAAIRFLRANAATYGLDPDRIAAWGGSAGGHLALLVGTTNNLDQITIGGTTIDLEGTVGAHVGVRSNVAAVGAWYPPTELLTYSQFPNIADPDNPTSSVSALLGATLQESGELAKSASPITYVTREAPPILCIHGSADLVVPVNQSARFIRKAAGEYGLDAELQIVPDVGHGVGNFSTVPVEEFFDRVLKNLPDTTLAVSSTGGTSFDESSGLGTAPTFVITRSGSTTSALDVPLVWSGTVAMGEDISVLPLNVTIAPGSPTATIQPQAFQDSLVEGDETLTLTLARSEDYRLDANATSLEFTLTDDESTAAVPGVSLSIPDGSCTEGGDFANLRFTRTGPTTSDLFVDFRAQGDALRGKDYFDIGSTVRIPLGSATIDIGILPINDDIAEPTELILFELLASTDYSIASNPNASISIIDDDRTNGIPILNVEISGDLATEGSVDSRVSAYATNILGTTSNVNVTLSGTAGFGSDYSPPSPLVMPAFGLVADTTIAPIDDPIPEGIEEIVVKLLPTPGFQLGIESELRVPIDDNDTPPLGPPPLNLAMTEMPMGEACTISIWGGSGFAPYVLYASQDRAYANLASLAYPVLIFPVNLLVLSQGNLDFFGRTDFIVQVPYDPILVERRYYFQALALDVPIRLSNRIGRRPFSR